ncbi:MAG: GIY-YIG nuclease family protein [Candidatus Korobacteraceae bacterium]
MPGITDDLLAFCDGVDSMAREHRYFVYIVASKSRRIYTGVTGNIFRRVMQHKRGEVEGFTQRYKINRLVHYQEFQYIDNAIRREKVVKGWLRAKKIALIERENPTWDDLAEDWGKPLPTLPLALGSAKQVLRYAQDDNFSVDATKRSERFAAEEFAFLLD